MPEHHRELLFDECRQLLCPTDPFLTNAANFAAWIFHRFSDLNWVGFYLARPDGLWLGPFQGKPACTFINFGQGVCGTAAVQLKPVVVPDVEAFPGHIVCDPASRSEAVFPLIQDSVLWGVFDLDSPVHHRFEPIASLLHRLMRIFVNRVTMDLPFGISIDAVHQKGSSTR